MIIICDSSPIIALSILDSLQKKADFLLIDEKRGRRIAAYNHIKIVGTLGILLLSKEKGLIPSIKPLLDNLQCSYIRISDDLYQKALTLAKE